MIIPNTKINLATNIRDVLNGAGGKVGNKTSSFFATAANINPYSKRKPIVLGVDHCQDFDKDQPHYYEDWWKGSNGYCGFIPCQLSSLSQIPSNMDGNMNGWSYQLPVGGTKSPMRLGDFRKYDTEAKPMLYGFTTGKIISNQFESSEVTGMCMITPESDTNLSFNDFNRFKNCYFGMYIVQEGGSQYRYKTTTQTLGEGANAVSISSYDLKTGKWTAYPFISDSIQDGIQMVAGSFFTVPGNEASTFEVVSSLVTLTVRAQKNQRVNEVNMIENVIEIEVYLKSTGGATTFTNNFVMIRRSDSEFDDPFVNGELQNKIDDVTIPNDGSTNLIHSATYVVTNQDVYNDCLVWVSLQSGAYKTSLSPMTSVPGDKG